MESFLSFKSSFSSNSSKHSSTAVEHLSHDFNKNSIRGEETIHYDKPINPRDRLEFLLRQVDNKKLSSMMQHEFKTMLVDQQRLVTMLEQRSEVLENENDELKVIINDNQRRYEKAVREMQFFKKKYDTLKQIDSQDRHPSSSVSESTPNSVYNSQIWPTSPTVAPSIISEVPSSNRPRNNSNAGTSMYSSFSSGTDATSIYSNGHRSTLEDKKLAAMNHHLLQNHSSSSCQSVRNPSIVSSYSTPSTTPSMISGASSIMSVPLPMSPARSSVSATGNSIIQQRRTDPLTFGGSDALWDTIAKGQGSDVTVEKIISNFLRRGGSPNTAKQSPSTNTVKYGFGMIHALIVTKSQDSLDSLLNQGANANAVTMSQIDEEKVSPCFLAASIGWLAGLEKLVLAGGDLMSARGGGARKKTALHVAAEFGHAAVVEYIVNMTQGVLNLETDAVGANTLHYACASGHTELVAFVIEVCQVAANEKDYRGESPLHWATKSGRFEVVTLLIERFGCDVNSYVSKKVGTPYDVAKSGGYKKIAEYLKSIGGVTAKKMDKKRDEDLSNIVPKHLEAVLAKNGFFMD